MKMTWFVFGTFLKLQTMRFPLLGEKTEIFCRLGREVDPTRKDTKICWVFTSLNPTYKPFDHFKMIATLNIKIRIKGVLQ